MQEQDVKSVVVMGMPRSGTSVTMGIAQILGVDLGPEVDDRVVPVVHPSGIREDPKFMSLNAQALGFGNEFGGLFNLPLKVKVSEQLRDQMRALIIERAKGKKLWGFKDPRLAFIFKGYYADLLPNPHLIFVHRKPESLVEATRRYSAPLKRDDILRDQRRYQRAVREIKKMGFPYCDVDFHEIRKNPIQEARKIARLIGTRISPQRRELIEEFVLP